MPQPFRLSKSQRYRLRAKLKTHDASIFRRVFALLEMDKGAVVARLAESIGVSSRTIYRWRSAWLAGVALRATSAKSVKIIKRALNEKEVSIKEKVSPLPAPPTPEPSRSGTAVGIDLVAKHEDIKRIVRKHFRVPGLDPDDLLQEIYCAIMRKNNTPSAWDPSRSSFSHYVYVVARSILCNMLDKSKRRSREFLVEKEMPDAMDERDPIAAFEYVMDSPRVNKNQDLKLLRHPVLSPANDMKALAA